MSALLIAMCLLTGAALAAVVIAVTPRARLLPVRSNGAAASTSRTPSAPTPQRRAMRLPPTGAPALWRLVSRNPHCPLRRMLGDQCLTTTDGTTAELPRCSRMDCDCRYERVREQRLQPRRTGNDRREELRLDLNDDDRRRQADRRLANRTWSTHAAW